MSNIENLINQSRRMPAFAACNYLDYHRYLQVRKCQRLAMELKKTKEAIEKLKKEIEARNREIEEKKRKARMEG